MDAPYVVFHGSRLCAWLMRRAYNEMLQGCIDHPEQWEWPHFHAWMSRSFGINFEVANKEELSYLTRDALKTILLDKIQEAYEKRKETLGKELLSRVF